MHRHEYALQMEFAMLTDNALIQAEKLWFHLAPDAGPDDTFALLRTLYANPNARFATLKQLCVAAAEEYNAGKRSRDSLQIVQLVNLINSKPIRLTELGIRIATAATRLQVDLLHYLLYTGWDERQPTLRGPLCTYRQVCNILSNGGADKVNHASLVRGVRHALDARFAEVAEYQQLHLSLSGKSIRGVTVWLERLCPPALAEGQFAPRRDCPTELLLLALGWVYRDLLPPTRRISNVALALDSSNREALCRLCLLQPDALDPLLDQAIDRHRQYLTDDGRGAGGVRSVTLHRLPQLSDNTLLGRAAMRNVEQ
jgi:hypothetical protein